MSTRIIGWQTRVKMSLDGLDGDFIVVVKRLSAAAREELREFMAEQPDGDGAAFEARAMEMLGGMVDGIEGLEFVWDEHGSDVTAPATIPELFECVNRFSPGLRGEWWSAIFNVVAQEQFVSSELPRPSRSRPAGGSGSRALPREPNGASTPTADHAEPQA